MSLVQFGRKDRDRKKVSVAPFEALEAESAAAPEESEAVAAD